MTGFWTRLSARERLLIGALVLVGVGGGYFQFVWTPLQETRGEMRRAIALSDRALAAAAPFDAPVVAETVVDRPPPARRVTESARGAGLTLRRIETDGDLTRLVLADAEFAALVDWLALLERDHALLVSSIEIDRRPEPGTVAARIALESP